MIRMNNVSLYRKEQVILNRVNWHVEKGQHWVILGLNGSGKTTLLNLINGYLWPNEGSIEVMGQLYGKTYIPDLRKKIGWVSNAMIENFSPQDPVIEIILSGKFGAMRLFEKVNEEEIQEAVGVAKHFHCDHLVNKPFGILSQGEKQRVQLARAFMANLEILILDEPCTALDLIERENVLQTIELLAKQTDGPTLICVTHHVEEVLPVFTHVLLLKDGESVAADRRENILTAQSLSIFFGQPIDIQVSKERVWLVLQ